jgi:hypothetical protein
LIRGAYRAAQATSSKLAWSGFSSEQDVAGLVPTLISVSLRREL